MLTAFADGRPLRGVLPPPGSGMQVWLKADAGVATSGSNVTSWVDQSGMGHNFTTAAGTPVLLSPGSGINGLPAIRFSDTGVPHALNCYLSALFNPSTWAGITVVFAVRTAPDSLLSQFYQGVVNVRETTRARWSFNASNKTDGNGVGGFGTNGTVTPGSYSPALTNSETIVMAYQYDKANWTWSGATAGTIADTSFPAAVTNFYIGSADYSSGQFTGDIGEVLIYDHSVSASDLVTVKAYLHSRWGA